MTNREFYQAVIDGNFTDETKDFAIEAISKLDETNAKRKAKNAEKSAANVELAKAIVATLTEEPKSASDIANEFGISPQKVASVLSRSGLAYNKVKVKAGKATHVGYTA